jgi:hypothetical protein
MAGWCGGRWGGIIGAWGGILVTLCGCGGGTTPPPVDTSPTVRVSGVVRLNGKPFRGSGYLLVLVDDAGRTGLFPIGNDGTFTGTAPVGSLKGGVLPEAQALEAHGDVSKFPAPVTVTVDAGGSANLIVELSAEPPPLPKPTPGAAAGHHSG